MLSWWAHQRANNTYTRTSLDSKTPTHTQHKESILSLIHSPHALHSLPVLFRGFGEESQLSSSVCVVSNHQVYQANQAPIPAPNTIQRPTIALMQSFSCHGLNREDNSKPSTTIPKMQQQRSSQPGEINSPQNASMDVAHNMGKTTTRPWEMQSPGKNTQTMLRMKLQSPILCVSESTTQDPQISP